jgi:hypothetical protein
MQVLVEYDEQGNITRIVPKTTTASGRAELEPASQPGHTVVEVDTPSSVNQADVIGLLRDIISQYRVASEAGHHRLVKKDAAP